MVEESIFECLRCGKESVIETLPPRCRYCNSGNGIVRASPSKSDPLLPGADRPDSSAT